MSNATFGKIQFSAKDLSTPTLKYDRLAVTQGGTVMMLSIIAENNFVKAVRAILNGAAGGRANITATDGKIAYPNLPGSGLRQPGTLTPTAEDGYMTYIHRLNYGLCHALYVTKQPGFMPSFNDAALWRELMDVKYTTPLLQEWLPFLKKQLLDKGLLKFAESFGCECGVLAATSDNLDEIVTRGIRDGMIAVPQ